MTKMTATIVTSLTLMVGCGLTNVGSSDVQSDDHVSLKKFLKCSLEVASGTITDTDEKEFEVNLESENLQVVDIKSESFVGKISYFAKYNQYTLRLMEGEKIISDSIAFGDFQMSLMNRFFREEGNVTLTCKQK